jgi:glycerate-2-kinase
MARALLARTGSPCREGIVCAPRDTVIPLAGCRLFTGGHPLPDRISIDAALAALGLAARLDVSDTFIVMLSGGASALLAAPAGPLTLADKIGATQSLLDAGAPIKALNAVRKHLSAVKGGRLAAATRARVITLALSDIVEAPEDDPSVIASGPTVPDPTTFCNSLDVLRRFGVEDLVPAAARDWLEAGDRGLVEETPKPGDFRLSRSTWHLIGNRHDAMRGAAEAAERLGYRACVHQAPVVGEARAAGPALTKQAAEMAGHGRRPVCVIASGETVVRLTGHGKGGRNQELALAAARTIADIGEPMVLASVGTDGVDGPTDAAGAIVDSTTLDRARSAGLGIPEPWLARNDAYHFFAPLSDLIVTGPTGTNVADLQVVLIA